VNSWITQIIWQWIPDCWSGDRKHAFQSCSGDHMAQTVDGAWQIIDIGRL